MALVDEGSEFELEISHVAPPAGRWSYSHTALLYMFTSSLAAYSARGYVVSQLTGSYLLFDQASEIWLIVMGSTVLVGVIWAIRGRTTGHQFLDASTKRRSPLLAMVGLLGSAVTLSTAAQQMERLGRSCIPPKSTLVTTEATAELVSALCVSLWTAAFLGFMGFLYLHQWMTRRRDDSWASGTRI